MASVRFVFQGNSELVVPAASDRSAKLMVTGMRRRMEEGGLVEVRGEDGTRYVNADNLCFVEVNASGGGGARRTASRARAGGAKKTAGRKGAKRRGGR